MNPKIQTIYFYFQKNYFIVHFNDGLTLFHLLVMFIELYLKIFRFSVRFGVGVNTDTELKYRIFFGRYRHRTEKTEIFSVFKNVDFAKMHIF